MSVTSLSVKTRRRPLLLGIINSDVVIAGSGSSQNRSLLKEFGGHGTGIHICAQLNSLQSKKGVC